MTRHWTVKGSAQLFPQEIWLYMWYIPKLQKKGDSQNRWSCPYMGKKNSVRFYQFRRGCLWWFGTVCDQHSSHLVFITLGLETPTSFIKQQFRVSMVGWGGSWLSLVWHIRQPMINSVPLSCTSESKRFSLIGWLVSLQCCRYCRNGTHAWSHCMVKEEIGKEFEGSKEHSLFYRHLPL